MKSTFEPSQYSYELALNPAPLDTPSAAPPPPINPAMLGVGLVIKTIGGGIAGGMAGVVLRKGFGTGFSIGAMSSFMVTGTVLALGLALKATKKEPA